jgi:large subunit ribosomal protein L21
VYAIIQSGGRQVKVVPGGAVLVDRLDAAVGQKVTFEQVLFIRTADGAVVAGSPFVANARVIGIIGGDVRGPKIRVFRKKRRKGMRRTRGHRSVLTRVQIKEIEAEGGR